MNKPKNRFEARVIINGYELKEGEVMTLRVAITEFLIYMVPGCLGKDEHGKAMVELYRSAAITIQNELL